MDIMKDLTPLIPFLIPLILVQLALLITALVHVLRHEHYRVGNRVLWVIIVVFVNILGPIAYFAFGRSDE